MIRACRAGKCAVAVGMRMSAVVAAPGWLARPHKQRRSMPGPGHQDGESKGKNHLGADGFAEHVVFFQCLRTCLRSAARRPYRVKNGLGMLICNS